MKDCKPLTICRISKNWPAKPFSFVLCLLLAQYGSLQLFRLSLSLTDGRTIYLAHNSTSLYLTAHIIQLAQNPATVHKSVAVLTNNLHCDVKYFVFTSVRCLRDLAFLLI